MAKDKHQIPEIKLYGNAETVKKIKQALSGKPSLAEGVALYDPARDKQKFIKARRSSHDIGAIDLHYKFMENHFGRPLRDIEKNTIMQQNTEPEIGYGARAEIESVPIIKRVSLNFSFPSTKERKKQNYIKQTRHNWKYKLYLTLQELNKKKKC